MAENKNIRKINGYFLKDAVSRKASEDNAKDLTDLTEEVDALEDKVDNFLWNADFTTEQQVADMITQAQVDNAVDLSDYAKVEDIPTKTSELTNDSNFITSIPSEYVTIEDLGYITPQMFGAKADGITDDSQAILDAIEALPKDGGVLYFPAGTYIHGDGTTTGLSYQQDTSYSEGHAYYPAVLMQNKGVDDKIGRSIKMDFEGYTNLTIRGDGAILQSHPNNGECSNNRFFTFKRCENVIIEGITIDAKRHERGIHFSDYSPGGYDLARTNIQIDYCKRVTVRNVISKGSQMDGMAIGHGTIDDYSEDILIENCKFLDNHRQGISIEGATNVTVRDTECSYNGTGDGILPKSGIDIEAYGDVNEYEHYSFNYNILIDNCYFDGNGYQNIVANNNSYNVVVQNCTFENAWVNAQKYTDAVLLNSKLVNCNLSNGYRRIAHNNIIYNKGGYLMQSIDVAEDTECIMEHNIIDLTPTTDTFATTKYNTIRLTGKERFKNNHVKNAISVTTEHYPLHLTCLDCIGNTFELTTTSVSGETMNLHVHMLTKSAESKYKDNKFTGGYTVNTMSFNEYYRTDETMGRSYNSRVVGYGEILSLLDYNGLMKLTIRYLEQIEEVLICKPSNYCHHYIFQRNSNLSNNNLVTIYKDSSKNYYLKSTYANTSISIECAYCYSDTQVDGLEYVDWLTTSSVEESSLTEITAVDTKTLTASLKSNYDKAYTHSTTAHAPSDAQKNSDITKEEIEAKLTGNITTHTHDGMGDYVPNDWGASNVGMVLMVGSDGKIALYDLADYNPNAQFFTVTQNLTNVSSDFNKTEAKENMPLTITLVTTNGKKMGTVTVIMNGNDVTSAVYNDSTGKVVISALNGDLIINAKAMLYTNLADPTASDWVTGQKLDYMGNPVSSAIGIISNSIPVTAGDTVRIKGLCDVNTGSIASYVILNILKSDASHYYTQCIDTVKSNGFFKNEYTEDISNAYIEFTFITGLDIGSIIVSGEVFGSDGETIGDVNNIIITVNEEIVE